MLKAVIFDFDGVMVDSEPLHFKAFQQVLADKGVKLSKEQYYTTYLGYSDYDCVAEVSRDFELELTDSEVEDLIKLKTVAFEDLARQDGCLIEGVREFVSMLCDKGIRMAICSGALRSDIDLLLRSTELTADFETIVTADDVVRSKPDPESYHKVLEGLKAAKTIDSDECVVIEDSHWGLAAARAAGLKCIGVTNTYSAEALDGNADIIVDNLQDLKLDELNKLCSED
ncbi:Phosphorylated carbohydrates phosphatase [Anaerohalosphaera lusitana]|uniref:Phosphorylated carbohydrates phosphatase n=1 Tax=Anaerohalosphaera lusitana TaxID=1936003 RepID=A0A1U9NKS9_9BACT|nr:HAD family phosphatase [Anaerohalosphaera lusitana]AQT68543.1 Phosphorylated carbohydrates phosphatase [Anaerohalosphaera lusitana]